MLKKGYDAVRTERYKYIRYRELKDMIELYDLRADPYELSNLIAEPAAGPVRQQMEVELKQIISSNSAQWR